MSQTEPYEVRLFQHTRVHTETFIVEANSPADALKKGEEIVKSKDMTEKYNLEVESVERKTAQEFQDSTKVSEPVER